MATVISQVIETAKEKLQGKLPQTMTLSNGCPVAHLKNSMTAGPHGPVLMQDRVLMDKLQHFDRENIPPRNVHAPGYGAYGKLTITKDITQYSRAAIFSKVGKETSFFARLSGTFTEKGDPDTIRDIRGFALKFYTEEGNWDLMTINTPVFNARDMKQGPDGVHACKRDPRTGNWYPTQFWDFIDTHPEALHFAMMMYTDRGGTPMSFRYMHSYGCNTFSFVNANNQRFWVKFHLVCPRGAKGFNFAQAKLIAGEDPNFLGRDLYEAIERSEYPTWKLCCQIMTEEEGYKNPITFDATKVWSHKDFPLIEIGTLELNRNPIDYFAEVEQVAFSPANIVPGISFSPDKLLQGRLFVYDDTQNHRIGPNFKHIPINRPRATDLKTPYVGGNHNHEIKDKFPHYWPSNFGGLQPDPNYLEPPVKADGPAGFYDYPNEGTDQDLYGQPRAFWNVLTDLDKQHLCENIAASLEKVPHTIASKVLVHFNAINRKFGGTVENALEGRKIGTFKKTESELVLKQFSDLLISK